ncbi:GDSL esterase/lipase At5g45670-like [Macadamia integrifolia]|uniref:GDSL esterase/lipase At5g45670-like n=1 Tax=Macadamia integrifolia TaxID=60698 RepID=UPI001C4F1FA3|nr:GDSL esterase/lipase At5g45670-like [Macadamia integrifolia]
MMSCEEKTIWVLPLTLMTLAGLSIGVVQAEPQVPCYFIFGDSLVDNGNNMALPTVAKALTLPYGIDFPRGPTGRFTNGRTVVDVVAQLLGFDDFIPPHATTRGPDVLKGLNYGSSAAGIRDDTGQEFGRVNGLNRQLDNHMGTILQVIGILGNQDKAGKHLSQCVYSVGMGSNDYLGYMNPQRRSQYTPEQYADTLIRQYSKQLRTLYSYGARKVAIMGVGPVGYSPFAISECSRRNGWACVEGLNSAAQLFNAKVKGLVDNFNKNLPEARFTYLNAYHILDGIWRSSSSYGFRVTSTSCCERMRDNSQYACMPLQTPCSNRTQYTFFDAFHPTEAVNLITGSKYYSAESPLDAYPFDIHGLVH